VWKEIGGKGLERKELKKLFRKFSEIKDFDGWVIGKLVFYKREKDPEIVCVLKKRREKAAVLEVEGEGLCIEMYLLKPGKAEEKSQVWGEKETLLNVGESQEVQKLQKPQTPQVLQELQKDMIFRKYGFSLENCVEVISKVFSEEEILAFAADVEDENPIHRTQKPVVPGLLLAEWMWVDGKISLEEKKIVFHAPAYARETVTVYWEKERKVYFGVSDGRILWKVSGNGKAVI
jgi:hypothetical protein